MASPREPQDTDDGDDFRSKLLPIVREALTEVVETEIKPAFERIEEKIPSEERIAAIAHAQMKALLADATKQADAIRANNQDADLEEVRVEGAESEEKPRQSIRKKGVDKILALLDNEHVANRVVDRVLDKVLGLGDAVTVMNQLHQEQPDLVEFMTSKWAPDPLANQLDVLLAQQGVKAFDTGQKGMYKALLDSGWRPPTTLTGPPSTSSPAGTDEPDEPKPARDEPSGSVSGGASLVAAARG